MSTAVIGLFETYSAAQQVVTALVEAGGKKNDIIIFGAKGDHQEAPGTRIVVDGLVKRGYQEDRAQLYAKAVQQGGALVVADTQDDQTDQALAIMGKHDILTPDELLQAAKNRSQDKEEVQTAQVVEEELHVGKRQTTGGKRLTTEVTERPVEERITLHEEHIEVERQQSGRKLSPQEADRAFEEQVIEMTETSERAVVSKEAHVVEEVTLRKHAGEHQETVRDTVRRSEVNVEDIGETSETSEPKARVARK